MLATIAYYDILEFPLTLPEIYKYLVNPSRVSILNKPIGEFTQEDVGKQLENLVKLNFIGNRDAFYFLGDQSSLYEIRRERAKIAEEKWIKFLDISRRLRLVPYIRGIFASGSMSMDNTDLDSDFDVLVIAVPGRIYTARFLLLVLASVFRSRRRWFDRKAPDKLCFNHYITEDNLHIEHHSLYNAQSYAHLKPVSVPRELFEKFFTANNWINKYLYNFKPVYDDQRTIASNKFLLGLAKFFELILNSKLGDWTEAWVKRYQQGRIKRNPATRNSGGRIIINDKELEFHPNSFERYLIDKYNQSLKNLGILAPYPEKDSGLVP